MNIDTINDIEILRTMLRQVMVQLKRDWKNHKKGDYLYYNFDEEGITVFYGEPIDYEIFSYEEAEKYFNFG